MKTFTKNRVNRPRRLPTVLLTLAAASFASVGHAQDKARGNEPLATVTSELKAEMHAGAAEAVRATRESVVTDLAVRLGGERPATVLAGQDTATRS